MVKVSLCMIVKDEEHILKQCLNSIHNLADEIIITDTGSKDSTVAIASEFGANIQHFKWINDFSAARNYCQKFATHKYILTWDADCIMNSGSNKFFLELKAKGFLNLDLILGAWHVEMGDNNRPIKTLAKPILYNKDKFHWESPIHNQLVPNDNEVQIRSKIFNRLEFIHHKDREKKAHRYRQTAAILENALTKNYDDPRLLFYYGESLLFDKNYMEAEKTFRHFLEKFVNTHQDHSIFALEKLLYIFTATNKSAQALPFIQRYRKLFWYHPRYKLLYADALALSDFTSAQEIYEGYLKAPVSKENDNLFFDSERFIVHPKLMLARIYILADKPLQAKALLDNVIDESNLQNTINAAKLLLTKIKKSNATKTKTASE